VGIEGMWEMISVFGFGVKILVYGRSGFKSHIFSFFVVRVSIS
jgi:hypothetical protein